MFQNIHYGLRMLVKNPGFTVTAILTLALGIGATTATFSVVYAVFEPMPYPKPDQLVMVWAGVREDTPEINLAFAQTPWPQASMAIRTQGDPKAMIKSIAAAVNSVDPDLPLAGAQTIDEIVSGSLAIDRFSVVLFAAFGILGLLLAAVGIYGVMAFGVAQRTHEFGIRMALGAHRSRVMSLVLKEGTILAIAGATIGLGGAYLVGRAMQSTLFGVKAFDVPAFAGVLFLLLAVAWLACLIPAWRASRVEPMVALRDE